MKRILLITTGGTIVSEPTEGGLAPLLRADEILRFVPGLEKKYDIQLLPVMNIESPDLMPEMWPDMVKAIREHYYEYDGFVILHGTDTLCFTASALNYMIKNSAKPIVVTGSQYPIENDLTDGKKNLHDAIIFAAESNMPGIFVVFDSKVIAGGRVKKISSKHYDAFRSAGYPEVASVIEDRVNSFISTFVSAENVTFTEEINESVTLLKLYPGIKAEWFDDYPDKFDAVILEGYGVGGIPASFIPHIEEWSKRGLLVIFTTQAVYGGTDLDVYTVGHALTQSNTVIETFDMTTEAVVAKTMVITAQTKDPEQVRKQMWTEIGHDIIVPEGKECVF